MENDQKWQDTAGAKRKPVPQLMQQVPGKVFDPIPSPTKFEPGSIEQMALDYVCMRLPMVVVYNFAEMQKKGEPSFVLPTLHAVNPQVKQWANEVASALNVLGISTKVQVDADQKPTSNGFVLGKENLQKMADLGINVPGFRAPIPERMEVKGFTR